MVFKPGQRVKIESGHAASRIEVKLHIEGLAPVDLRVLLLALDANEKLVDGTVVDGAGGPRSCDGVTPNGRAPGGFELELDRVSNRFARLVLVLCVTEDARKRGMQANVIKRGAVDVSCGGRSIGSYVFEGSDFSRETALCLLEFYRKEGWRFLVVGAGFLGGLPSLIARYGGRVQDIESGTPSRSSTSPTSAQGRGALPPMGVPPNEPLRVPSSFAGRRDPHVPAGLTPALGLILVEHDRGVSTGTGFMIGPGGYFVTCAHVVEHAKKIGFVSEGTQEVRPAALVHLDPAGDLALLHTVDRIGSTDWLMLSGADAVPSLGDKLGLLGYPLGGTLGISLTYSQGVVNSIRKHDNVPILQVDTGAAPGSSGGPVFRRTDGRVIGVLTSGLTDHAGMLVNFAVDARRLYQLGWLQ